MNFNESVDLANKYIINENEDFLPYSDNLIFLIKNIKNENVIGTLLYNNNSENVENIFNKLIEQILGSTKKIKKVKIIDSDKVIVFNDIKELKKSLYFSKRKIVLDFFEKQKFYCYEAYNDSFNLLYTKNGNKSNSDNNKSLKIGNSNRNDNNDDLILFPKGD